MAVVFIFVFVGGFGWLPSLWANMPPWLLQTAAAGVLPFSVQWNEPAEETTAAVSENVLASREQGLAERQPEASPSAGGLLLLPDEEEAEQTTSLGDQPLACIYCTHTTENYADQDRNTQAGGVLEAARALADTLNAQGVPTILCETVHDAPDWSSAYDSSMKSIEALKDQYPSLTLFVDVHRDSSIAGVSTQLAWQGENWAKMMFVVGSNQRLQHDHWQENQAFAQKTADLLEEKAPGIIRDVRVSANRYNQHISPQALLVELGSTDNALEEAKRSAVLLGETLAEIMFAQAAQSQS